MLISIMSKDDVGGPKSNQTFVYAIVSKEGNDELPRSDTEQSVGCRIYLFADRNNATNVLNINKEWIIQMSGYTIPKSEYNQWRIIDGSNDPTGVYLNEISGDRVLLNKKL